MIRSYFYLTYFCKRSLATKLTSQQMKLMARGLPKKEPLKGVEDIVVVASGKGGVGKSTVAVNLAVSLANSGKRVGLLDADVFGPSIPLMMNIKEEPLVNANNLMVPPVNYGVKCLSMGLLSQDGQAVIWRGPLVMSALHRLLKGALWEPIDVLIVDTPPGTGDIHLSLSQNVPISGVVLVSTPQTASLEVVQRGAQMYKTLKVPIFGIVENMAYAVCSKCGNHMDIFQGSTSSFATKMNTTVLASVPLDPTITQCCDKGMPMVTSHPKSAFALSFSNLAKRLVVELERKKKVASTA